MKLNVHTIQDGILDFSIAQEKNTVVHTCQYTLHRTLGNFARWKVMVFEVVTAVTV